MNHAILTRFNLPSTGPESVLRASRGWLEDRVRLFERYCLPSVAAQTDRRFRWIIYFDPNSPSWLKERIDRHVAERHYVPVFREAVSHEELLDDIGRAFDTLDVELMTTNLDNDDALAHDFLERLHAEPSPASTAAFFFGNGLVKGPGGVYLRHDRENAFPSVRESWSDAVTCWSAWHNRLARSMPTVEIGGRPGWLQVVHGRNVSNRTRGRLVAPERYADLFPGLLDDVPAPSGGSIAVDRFVRQPSRHLRDTGIRVAKPVALRILGPEGLDRVKTLVRGRPSGS